MIINYLQGYKKVTKKYQKCNRDIKPSKNMILGYIFKTKM